MNPAESIVVFHDPADADAAEIVASALARSFTAQQVQRATYADFSTAPAGMVLIHAPASVERHFAELQRGGRKVLFLGRLAGEWPARLGLRRESGVELPAALAAAEVDARHPWNESPLAWVYDEGHELGRASPIQRRPFCRYDFADEWNNLGFGKIRLDGNMWSLAETMVLAGATPIAGFGAQVAEFARIPVMAPRDRAGILANSATGHECGYTDLVCASLCETIESALLWFNRAVGPVDSLEWQVIESFFCDYGAGRLACFPCIGEIPAGYDAAACARLDCDEAIASARPLFEFYAAQGIPLSLAVKTGQPIEERDRRLLEDVVQEGGAVVSHSVRHLPNWGGSSEVARQEALESRQTLETLLPALRPIRHAVSPFHQNPRFAVEALAECGYTGVITGIIRNDPEYLLGRAGKMPWTQTPVVSHSQQCMLHGDCWRRYGENVLPYVRSWNQHRRARATFGYLDHPFSARYQYGWSDEAERLKAHRLLIQEIDIQENVWRPNLNQLLDFLHWRDTIQLNRASLTKKHRLQQQHPLHIDVRWQGERLVF